MITQALIISAGIWGPPLLKRCKRKTAARRKCILALLFQKKVETLMSSLQCRRGICMCTRFAWYSGVKNRLF